MAFGPREPAQNALGREKGFRLFGEDRGQEAVGFLDPLQEFGGIPGAANHSGSPAGDRFHLVMAKQSAEFSQHRDALRHALFFEGFTLGKNPWQAVLCAGPGEAETLLDYCPPGR